MESDPITDSPDRPLRSGRMCHSPHDSGDELFANDTVATMPLTHPYNPANATQPSPYFSPAPPQVTQPTQILDTPLARRADPDAIVQVPASSPVAQSQFTATSPSPRTFFSKGTASANSNTRPNPIPTVTEGSFDDDPPIASSSEDELAASKSDIPQSRFHSKSKSTNPAAPSPFQQAMAQFTYTGLPQKRSADDMANAYSSASKRPRPAPRQTAPSRAQPVEKKMTLDDVPDFLQRQKVKRMLIVYPDVSIELLVKALRVKRGSVDDAMAYIVELEEAQGAKDAQHDQEMIDLTADDDNSPVKRSKSSNNAALKPTPSLTSKRSSNQVSKVEKKSIHEKWSNITQPLDISDDSASVDPSPVKPRRRLVKGRRAASPSSSFAALTPQKPAPAPRQKKMVTIDSDEDDSDVEMSEEQSDDEAAQETSESLLAYINQCSAQDLADLSDKPLEECEFVLTKRPFKSLDAVRLVDMKQPELTKAGKPKKNHRTTGDKLLDPTERMWASYASVDQLVTECKGLGQPILADMKRLGFHTSRADGKELSILNFDDPKNDSGIGTPSSSADPEDDDDVVTSTTQRLGKPAIMSEDVVLKDYQIVGLNWLSILWRRRISGILADDMGLGKTCQVIAFLSYLYETGQKGVHLVVVPNSTLENWLREFRNFSPKLCVEPFFGNQNERPAMKARILENIDKINVIVTTYECTTHDVENKFLRKLNPTVCVFDEGHKLRSKNTKVYKYLMRIPAELRLLLTGTPIQNNLQELVSILAFLSPKMFENHQENLDYIFKKKAKTNEDSHASLLSAQRTTRARTMMTPFILRRKKEQVLGQHLPKKTVNKVLCDMVPEQKEVYDALLARQVQVLLDREAGVPNDSDANVTVQLRQAAVHPLMATRTFYDDEKLSEMAEDFVKAFPKDKKNSLGKLHELLWMKDSDIADEIEKLAEDSEFREKYQVPQELWYKSGKILKMRELVRHWCENGDRVLIFSQWVKTLNIIQRAMEDENIPYLRMDGSTPTWQRQGIIDLFYEDGTIPVFLLSTKTGGTGINLTPANKVLIFDEQYNPQEDLQAESRAHRVGQTRDVEVVRLITEGTIEEQIHALGKSKLAMDERIAGVPGTSDEGVGASSGEAAEKKAAKALADDMFKKLKEDGRLEQLKKGGDAKDLFKSMLEGKGIEMAE